MDVLTVPVEFIDRRYLPKVCPFTGENGDLVPHRIEMRHVPWWLWGLRLVLVLGAFYGTHHAWHYTSEQEIRKTSGMWVERRILNRLRWASWGPRLLLVGGLIVLFSAMVLIPMNYPQWALDLGWWRVILFGSVLAWVLIVGAVRPLFRPRGFNARLHSTGEQVDLHFDDEMIGKAFATALDAYWRQMQENEDRRQADYAAANAADDAGRQDEDAATARKRRRQHAGRAFRQRLRERRDEQSRNSSTF